MLIDDSIVNTRADPNMVDKDSLQPARRTWIEVIESRSLCTEGREVDFVEKIVSVSIHIEDLGVLVWFVIVDNIAVKALLGTLFIDLCIRGKILSEGESLLWYLRAVTMLLPQMKVQTVPTDTRMIDVNTMSITDTAKLDHSMCCVADKPTKIPLVASGSVG